MMKEIISTIKSLHCRIRRNRHLETIVLNVEDNLYLDIRKNAQQLVKLATIVTNRIICQKFVLLQKISNLAVKSTPYKQQSL